MRNYETYTDGELQAALEEARAMASIPGSSSDDWEGFWSSEEEMWNSEIDLIMEEMLKRVRKEIAEERSFCR
jgi:hypothetical protein